MKIKVLGGSTSKKSINKIWASYVAGLFDAGQVEVLDLNDYKMPIYDEDYEQEHGVPLEAIKLLEKLQEGELLVISLSEHNGSYTAAFKNTFDWLSRVESKFFKGIRVFLMATSPGSRGGIGVLEAARARFPIHGADIVGQFSLPFFDENFKFEKGLINQQLKDRLFEEVNNIKHLFK